MELDAFILNIYKQKLFIYIIISINYKMTSQIKNVKMRPETKRELKVLINDGNVIPNNIDTSQIKDMSNLFENNKTFNKPINKWNTKNVTNMMGMFQGATSFNQKIVVKSQEPFILGILLMGYKGNGEKLPVVILKIISKYVIETGWDTSRVINMDTMFYKATSFNQPVGGLNTHKVIRMRGMFCGATSFNQPVEDFDTSQVINMSYLFCGATSFNQPVECLDTSRVLYMHYMFARATSFNKPVDGFNTSRLISRLSMFNGATSFNKLSKIGSQVHTVDKQGLKNET